MRSTQDRTDQNWSELSGETKISMNLCQTLSVLAVSLHALLLHEAVCLAQSKCTKSSFDKSTIVDDFSLVFWGFLNSKGPVLSQIFDTSKLCRSHGHAYESFPSHCMWAYVSLACSVVMSRAGVWSHYLRLTQVSTFSTLSTSQPLNIWHHIPSKMLHGSQPSQIVTHSKYSISKNSNACLLHSCTQFSCKQTSWNILKHAETMNLCSTLFDVESQGSWCILAHPGAPSIQYIQCS